MVTKDLGVTHEDMLAEVAAAIGRDTPGPEWVTIAEVAIAQNISKSTAAGRLERAFDNGIMEKKLIGNLRYFRMVKDDTQSRASTK